jgi:hypothetical protein
VQQENKSECELIVKKIQCDVEKNLIVNLDAAGCQLVVGGGDGGGGIQRRLPVVVARGGCQRGGKSQVLAGTEGGGGWQGPWPTPKFP